MKRDDKRPDRRLLRRDAEARPAREKDERAPEGEVPQDPSLQDAALPAEGEGRLLVLETKDACVVLPYHYEFAMALVPGPDGLQ